MTIQHIMIKAKSFPYEQTINRTTFFVGVVVMAAVNHAFLGGSWILDLFALLMMFLGIGSMLGLLDVNTKIFKTRAEAIAYLRELDQT